MAGAKGKTKPPSIGGSTRAWKLFSEGYQRILFGSPGFLVDLGKRISGKFSEGMRGLLALDAFAQPMTLLTGYVWQFLGNQIPPDIYAAELLFQSRFE
jgi:hypothetical protein